MKKILLSLLTIGVVATMGYAATRAFFSDVEISKDNILQAGAIDLKIDNSSWYNGVFRDDLSWELDDLDNHLFFNYSDLKPGDWGEDTISVHVNDNDAWACMGLDVTSNNEVNATETEIDEGDAQDDPDDIWDGELAQEINFVFWIDDEDNVYEEDEVSFISNPASHGIGGQFFFALADRDENMVGGVVGQPLDSEEIYHIGKFWCFGTITETPLPQQEGRNPADPEGPGFICDGTSVTNLSQTDAMTIDVRFYAEQFRNNPNYDCHPQFTKNDQNLENKDENWNIIAGDGVEGNITYFSDVPGGVFGWVTAQGLEPNSKYQITLNGPGGCTWTDQQLAGLGSNLFQSGYWNGGTNLSSTCGSPGEGVYNMNLINDHYTVSSNASGQLTYPFNIIIPPGTYNNVKVLVKKMLDEHVSPWVDDSTKHTTNLYETAAINFTVATP